MTSGQKSRPKLKTEGRLVFSWDKGWERMSPVQKPDQWADSQAARCSRLERPPLPSSPVHR